MESHVLSPPPDGFRLIQVEGFLVCLGVTFVLILTRNSLLDWENRSLFLLTTILAAAAFAFILAISRRKIFSAPFMYLLVFSLFHSGLFFAYAFGVEAPAQTEGYLLSFSGRLAVLLVAIGTSAYCAGVAAAAFFSGGEPFQKITDSTKLADRYVVCGFLLVFFSVAAWFVLVMQVGGIGLFRAPYLDFLAVTENTKLGYTYYGIGIGMIFLAACAPSAWRMFGFAAFVLFAAVAFPLGLRGEVLFSLTAALVVAGLEKPPVSTGKALVIGLILLCAITAVRQIRNVGVGGVSEKVSFAPAEAIAEMGSSIRPVVEVIRWAERDEPFLYGLSYWAPFDRALVYVLPGWTRPPANEDDRLLNVVVQKRVGPIGFSVIAEAYRNFAVPGVVVVMFLTGFLLGRFDRWPATPIGKAFAGIILFPMLIQIRNAFTQVPMQVMGGLAVLAVVVLASKISGLPKFNEGIYQRDLRP